MIPPEGPGDNSIRTVRNHWWWRPGWHSQRKTYDIYALVDGLLIDQTARALSALAGIDTLDIVQRFPPERLHLYSVGFTDDIPSDNIRSHTLEINNKLVTRPPIELEVRRPVLLPDRIILPVYPQDAIYELRQSIKQAVNHRYTTSPESSPQFVQTPGITIAYVNRDTSSEQILNAIDALDFQPDDASSLVAMLSAVEIKDHEYRHTDLQSFEFGSNRLIRRDSPKPTSQNTSMGHREIQGRPTKAVRSVPRDNFMDQLEPSQRHEVQDFMDQIVSELKSEYSRIQRRVKEDAGNAGDEAENNWAELLDDWLPSEVQIVTRGRILSDDGRPGPQVDVLVLHPGYPRKLLNKKMYFAGGVLGAFECKLTLRRRDIEKIGRSAREIRSLATLRAGRPYSELNSPIIYGVLAHSSEWSTKGIEKFDAILDRELQKDMHPRDLIDVICIGDLACWYATKPLIAPYNEPAWKQTQKLYGVGENPVESLLSTPDG